MKKKIFFLSILVICLAILASGTLAYFTAEIQTHNVITSGAVDIELVEFQLVDGKEVPYPKTQDGQPAPISAMPGVTVSKLPKLRNLDADCYVRAKYDISIKDASGKQMQLSEEQLAQLISLNMNTANWSQKAGEPDWWYYTGTDGKGILPHGQTSEALFTEVIFDGPNFSNEYQGATVYVSVNAQAVQAANNQTNALTALGWPEA